MQQQAGRQRIHVVDAGEQPLDAAFFGERRAEVGHEDVAGEQHAVVGHVDQQRVAGLAAARGPQREARAADHHLDRAVDRDVGLVGEHVRQPEVAAEETHQRRLVSAGAERQFLRLVVAADKTDGRVQAAQVAVASHMVPMRVGHEHRGQGRQLRHSCAHRGKRLARGDGRCAGVDGDQLAPVGRDDEVVLGEIEARHHVDRARHRLAHARALKTAGPKPRPPRTVW